MDNLEKLATLGTCDTRRGQTKQYVLYTTMRKQTQITYIRHESSYKQLEVKRIRTSFLSGNSKGTQNSNTYNRTTRTPPVPAFYKTSAILNILKNNNCGLLLNFSLHLFNIHIIFTSAFSPHFTKRRGLINTATFLLKCL
jgi:hypothetical protein